MKLLLIMVLCLPAAAVAQICPPPPDQTAARADLMATVRAAPDEMSARIATNALWALWATAPDAHAQDLLDTGLRRRSESDLLGARENFDALIAYCPDYAEGYNQRAFIAFIEGDYATALDDLEQALARSPDHIAALTGKALSLMSLGRVQAGQAALRAALALNPWLPERRMLIKSPPEPGESL